MSLLLGSSFLMGLLEMKDALLAYCKVLMFSSKYMSQGFKQAIMRQKELPPRLYLNKDVNLDSL
jgi:hypothetical protein